MSPRSSRPGRDLRAYAKGTQFRLILGGLLILIFVGNGLIWWVYGPNAVRAALLCTGAGLTPVMIIIVWLWILDKIVRAARGD